LILLESCNSILAIGKVCGDPGGSKAFKSDHLIPCIRPFTIAVETKWGFAVIMKSSASYVLVELVSSRYVQLVEIHIGSVETLGTALEGLQNSCLREKGGASYEEDQNCIN